MSRINFRSPYHVYHTDTNLTGAKLDLYIYTGLFGAGKPVTPTYTLNATAINEKVTFEISELCRDYLDISFDGNYTSQMLAVDYQITPYISGVAQTPEAYVYMKGYDGYGYFEDGVNPQNTSELMQSNTLIYKHDDYPVIIPIENNATKTINFYYKGKVIYTGYANNAGSTSSRINYITNLNETPYTYAERVALDGGTLENSDCLEAWFRNNAYSPTDRIEIINGSTTTYLDVIDVAECKHTPYKLTFVNKWGVLQDLWFFKRSSESISTKEEKYKSNILTNGSYSINQHQNRILTKQGNEKMVLNSGFVDEQYNEVFKQLMLSEQVWLHKDSDVLPINIETGNLNYKTSLNDGLINYTIECEFAYDTINNVR